MELPRRDRGDELLKPGELKNLRLRLRTISAKHDLSTVIACAFDRRTRMLPFTIADTRMSPAGIRAIGSAMVDAGFEPADLHVYFPGWEGIVEAGLETAEGRELSGNDDSTE